MGPRVNISNSTFVKNKAHRHGGVIYLATRDSNGTWEQVVTSKQYLKMPALSVIRTEMVDNEAQANGGECGLQSVSR